ncbi:MAG: tetratricopeptide repeat protein [bacterium]|nr:tetratricopeptide repeat protein [bacterium]
MAKKLKPVKRITKKELKEDKFVTTFFKAQKYLQDNQATILKIVGGVLLLAVITVFWISSKSRAEDQASYELGIAELKMQQSTPIVAAEELSKIAEKYRGTSSGDHALVLTAQLKLQAGQVDEALKAYEDYLKHGSKNKYLYPAALDGKAACLESKSKFEEAAQLYLKAAASEKNLFAAPQYHLDAARCYKALDQNDKAVAQYKLVISEYPKTAFAEDAQKKLKELGE